MTYVLTSGTEMDRCKVRNASLSAHREVDTDGNNDGQGFPDTHTQSGQGHPRGLIVVSAARVAEKYTCPCLGLGPH